MENAASLLRGDVAAGSLARLQLIVQNGPIVPIDPATVAVQILPIGLSAPSSLPVQQLPDSFSVVVLIPSGTPLGPAGITLSYNGQSTTANVNIVATSFGLYSAGGQTALAQNLTQDGVQLNNLTHPAHPLDYVTLWGTGLGPVTADQVTVLLGGHPFPVTYAGPSPSFAGLDQINFQVPDDAGIPQGCYVAANIMVGNALSNVGTLSLSRDTGPCRHPFGLSANQLATLDSGGQVSVGDIDVSSTIGPPPGPSLDPANGYVRTESASGIFPNSNASGLSVFSGVLYAKDYLAGCTFSGSLAAGFLARINPLNLGNAIVVEGPGGKQLSLLSGLEYSASVPVLPAVAGPDQLPPPFFSAGQWQAISGGSTVALPFTAAVSIPNPIQLTNYDQLTTIDRKHDLTVTWDPTTYSADDFLTLQLFNQAASELPNFSQNVFCRVPAAAGMATVPKRRQ